MQRMETRGAADNSVTCIDTPTGLEEGFLAHLPILNQRIHVHLISFLPVVLGRAPSPPFGT